jgi:transposase InsO family protein
MNEHRGEFPVSAMCRVLKVGKSGYYDWRGRSPGKREVRRARIFRAVFQSHSASRGVYGYRKVHRDVVDDFKIACCRETVRRIMRESGLKARSRRKYVVTTDSNHSLPVAENVLDRNFETKSPDRKWVAEKTYIRTLAGWLYLGVVMDLFSRRIVGWSMSDRLDSSLVCGALKMAITHRRPPPNLLHHSDRGSQYSSKVYLELLSSHDIRRSMSRKGDCWDNACAERFFQSLKTEWIGDTIYQDRESARNAVFEYIEMFYNNKRRHATLGYVCPAEFERRHAR